MENQAIVKIGEGCLKGEYIANETAKYYSFRGIPYAKPPVGELRFKAPVPIDPWSGIRDATKDGPACYARDAINRHKKIGSEDCLYLNVYTPKLPSESKNLVQYDLKPVMLFIHGGSFLIGSNTKSVYGPEYLVREDVVLVTINYRLGILGLLSLDDPKLKIPGNAAFKDMLLTLKWVQRNIKHFNGNPNNVTIFGESAGGAAVHALILSPTSKGLFHKAIIQSGSALNSWAYGKKVASKLGEYFGISSKDEQVILKHLQSVSVEDLHQAQESLVDKWDISFRRPMGITIENPNDDNPFLTQHPLDLLKTGNINQVPMIIGYTDREGMLIDLVSKDPLSKYIPSFEHCIPRELKVKPGTALSKTIAERIKKFYFGNKEPNRDDIDPFYKLQTDNFFVRDILRAAHLHAHQKKQPVYVYRMSIESSLNLFKAVSQITTPGVCHADDIPYLFSISFFSRDLDENSIENIGIKRFCKLWTNFAKTGNPNPVHIDKLIDVEWKPYTTKQRNFLDIGRELVVGLNPDGDRMNFWEEIYDLSSKNSKL